MKAVSYTATSPIDRSDTRIDFETISVNAVDTKIRQRNVPGGDANRLSDIVERLDKLARCAGGSGHGATGWTGMADRGDGHGRNRGLRKIHEHAKR